MKKRLLAYSILAICVAFVIIGLNVCPWFSPGPGVTIPNYLRSEAGMSADDVELLMKGPKSASWRRGTPVLVPNQGCVEHWRERGGTIEIMVFYDVKNRVVDTQWHYAGVLYGVLE